ncbi:hypothetical protein Tco_1427787 [Tanacetum coccineum]
MGDEHLNTIPATESDEFIKSSAENLVPTPSESKDASNGECDLPVCDDSPKSHLTFSNPLFDIDDDFTSSDDESFSGEDVPMENFKIFSNPLFDLDEESISTKVDQIDDEVLDSVDSIPPGIDHFDAEYDLLESLLNQDTSIDSSSKIDSLLDEFASELTLLKSIPPGINDDNLDPEGEIHLVERLLYDNSSPRPPEELNVENSIESFSPSPIPVENSDSLMEEIDLFLTPDDSMLLGIKNDDYDSEGDILFLEELLSNDSPSLLENESFHFDVPSSPRPPVKPPDDDEIEPDTGILTVKVDFPDCDDFRARSFVLHSLEYRIFTKGQKQRQIGQNRAREWKEREKTSPTVPALHGEPFTFGPCQAKMVFIVNMTQARKRRVKRNNWNDITKSRTERNWSLTAKKSVRPLPSHRLALRYTSHHLDRFTSGSSDHSSSDHPSADHSLANHTSGHSTSDQSLSRHTSPDTTIADSSSPSRFVYPPPTRTSQGSEAYLRWRFTPLSTIYPPTTSESSAGDCSSESSAGPSRKRCRSPSNTVPSSNPASRALVHIRVDLLPPLKKFRDSISPEDSIKEDIDADVLADIEADAAAIEVAAAINVEVEVDAGIGIETGDDIEDEDEGEAESSDRGTIEVGVDVVAGIDIPDGMLMPDAVEHLVQVKEVIQDIYGHVIEIPLQRVEDIDTGHRQLEAESLIASGDRVGLLDHVTALERSNARLQDTLRMESVRADRLQRCMGFMAGELRQIRRFRYYDWLRFRRLKAFAARRLGFRP